MLILSKIKDLQLFLSDKKQSGAKLGFVPTMGALHPGHLSLIQMSKEMCDLTVCSIFVNPTQFNDQKDLERYPRTPKEDTMLLNESGCDVLFVPEVHEIYPEKDLRVFDFGTLDKVLEGAHRPGHFNGVAQVVSKLFEIVQPDLAFFGSKDYQQVMIVRELVRQLQLKIEIVACPILREPDGLAMSSRNTLLSPEERIAASLIPQVMQQAQDLKNAGANVRAIHEHVKKALQDPVYNLDYFSICEKDTLQEVAEMLPQKTYMALLACFVGKIRLIDNKPLL